MTNHPAYPDRNNIQGVVFSGFGKFHSCHMIMRFPRQDCNVNGFVKDILPFVQTGASWGDNRPRKMLNIGFTFSGLQSTRVPMIRWDTFPIEFRVGPTSYYAQQNLFDLGESAPGNWAFGNDSEEKKVDAIVHCHGQDDQALDEIIEIVSDAATRHGVVEILPLDDPRGRYVKSPDLDVGFIHFGYRDGMNQPSLDWPDPWPEEGQYTHPDALNNFLVGYPKSAIMPGPSFYNDPNDNTGAFARDGCYNAFRVLYQDVEAFDAFLDRYAPEISQRLGEPADYAREWIAAKLNGRWRNGSPLVVSPDEPDPETAMDTDFTFSDDPIGMRCPFSAHTRVTNPRDQAIFRTGQPLPRILRRGMPFGRTAAPPDYSGERGLVGMFLCGSLGEQFEKMYNWINANNFSPVFTQSEQDPLSSTRNVPLATRTFTIPMEDGEPMVLDLAEYKFVITRGTAYCFIPSISALRTIADANSSLY